MNRHAEHFYFSHGALPIHLILLSLPAMILSILDLCRYVTKILNMISDNGTLTRRLPALKKYSSVLTMALIHNASMDEKLTIREKNRMPKKHTTGRIKDASQSCVTNNASARK